MIGFLFQGRVRIKIRIRVRVGVMFNVSIYHRSNCRRSKCRTFLISWEASEYHPIAREIDFKNTPFSSFSGKNLPEITARNMPPFPENVSIRMEPLLRGGGGEHMELRIRHVFFLFFFLFFLSFLLSFLSGGKLANKLSIERFVL